MTLRAQFTPEELALLEVVEDPIWLGEFLRNTRDGSPDKNEWPKREFAYRYYQRDILTDKHEFIALTAGRAVGKCQPTAAYIYTADSGYMSLGEIMVNKKDPYYSVPVWTLDPTTGVQVVRRAVFEKNGIQDVFAVRTQGGNTFRCTSNHPLLTEQGYVMLNELTVGDNVGVVTRLPPILHHNHLQWEELRWFGYYFTTRTAGVETMITVRYQAQIEELRRIADFMGARFRMIGDQVILRRAHGPLPHYGSLLLREHELGYVGKALLRRISTPLRRLPNAALKVMLEAYFSVKAVIDATTMYVDVRSARIARDIQEFMLRFGIETTMTQIKEHPIDGGEKYDLSVHRLQLRDYRAYYLFFTTFQLPGVRVHNLEEPPEPEHPFLRFEPIAEIVQMSGRPTVAVSVYDTESYITGNTFVHNSVALEDKLIYEFVNDDIEFPDETKEQTLVTANVAQMTPLIDHLRMRFLGSRFLQSWVQNFNMSKGTLDFRSMNAPNMRMFARIAGSRGESNVVGLHTPRIKGDEINSVSRALVRA